MKALLILTLFFSMSAFAAENEKSVVAEKPKAAVVEAETEPPIIKGTDIEVDSYDAPTDTFEVVIVKEPGVGPNIATSDDLFKATGIDPENKKNKDLVGSTFKLKEELKLLTEEEAAARKK
ncbi:hypothetical protein [Bdellovibrio reynosensis]|uniref:Uncharacterized protein n=1 Tax=Bdellovibrio reynosensis TaxID=2835041 RepID=A0ABY4C8E5_9BACT|nr:hypothetical protein [Bdellovibrio reynosensis]UOF01143.1 hypothetical protein MNR06_15700 [Bdellovibrio reynosensis]